MLNEIPATIPTVTVVATHMSKKVSDWGIRIATTASGRFAVSTVSPHPSFRGKLVSYVHAVEETEAAARSRANRFWVEMGL